MSIQKSIPMKRIIGEEVLLTSQVCMISDETYTTEGESVVITKELESIDGLNPELLC